MTIKLTGLNINRGVDFERSFTILAFGDIEVKALTMKLNGCALARMGGKLAALPPKSPGRRLGEPDAIHWDAHGEFAKLICAEMIKGYKALGGKLPGETSTDTEGDADGLRRMLGVETEEAYRACG